MERDKPIYVRPTAQPARVATKLPVKLTQKDIDRKQSQHDDQWLHERKGKTVTVKFLDGETLEGTVLNIRKFHFSIAMENGMNVMVYKVGVKYVAMDETECDVR